MQYMVVIEKGSNSFGAYVPDLPGCIAAAGTEKEVLHLIQESTEFHLEGLKNEGMPVPPSHSYSELVEVYA
uniref:Predicted nuclease of the RNAse H fold, HicB family n=1 Tax=Candidatus Kentrum sp. UNK TaxID=2126344 RepID=A0A451ABW4_9GAMM|nr:MAG: Predicted nuclease of the RNAse H fold, HicB family [Candidatus Kentron sp. UNK]VFK70846.1 MAG: Predicted nuclease of the RNAse H fold, HicB family [Candidatus Kentron sp. UNK]